MSDAGADGGGEAVASQSAPSDSGASPASPASASGKAKAAPATKSPRKLINSARGLGKTAFGLTEHQLMLADLFKSPTPVTPEGEPKNIEVLQQLAKPLARHRVGKFFEEEEKERELAKKNAVKAHDLPEPKNMEWILQNSKPLPRLKARKFDDELAELKVKPRKPKELPEPKNLERLLDLAKPLKSNKKFETLLAEEEALLIKKTGQGTFDPTVKKAFKPKPKGGPASPRKPAAAAGGAAGSADGEKKAGSEATSPSAAAGAGGSEEKKEDGSEQKSAESGAAPAVSSSSPVAADGGQAPETSAAAAGDAEEAASELGPDAA